MKEKQKEEESVVERMGVGVVGMKEVIWIMCFREKKHRSYVCDACMEGCVVLGRKSRRREFF